ncbi:MAG: helix-turn-helix domain-containing protein [Candidatus Magasanikbacteria bacterium]|nr:helix-turn-helix domain-containing protein [Candidatus Magasanikbacteria bacterium]
MAEKLTQNPQKEMVRVSISEGAKLFGLNPQTIRRAIANQELAYVVVGGRYKINFESLVRWSQTKTVLRHKLNEHGIGQYVDKWKIKNTLFSPSPKVIHKFPKQSKTNKSA